MSENPWEPPPERKASRIGLFIWLAALAGVGLAVFLLTKAFPGEGQLSDPYLIQTLAVLALVSSGLLFIRRVKLKETLRNVLMWLGVGMVLVIGFSYQEELMSLVQRLRADLIPGTAVQTSASEMVISASEGGGFHVYGKINDTPVRFLVDTGASAIVLSPADARRMGIDFSSLTFDRPYETANGIGYGASTVVDELTVGHIRLAKVRVSINGAAMSSSLLGMTFLNRMKSFNISGRKLILRY